jgi:uncharacterized protein (UPF0332 family)
MKERNRSISSSSIEIARLLEIADRDLQQAQIEALHLDTRFSLAYNAALQLATVTLRLHGIRVRKIAFHQQTFAELSKQLPPVQQSIALYFDRARRKRNVVAYEQPGAVSESEVAELLDHVERFRTWVRESVQRQMLSGNDQASAESP